MGYILIIDDDTALCEMLTEYLTQERFQVDCALDGRTGLKKACSGNYDMILLDVTLPGMNGFDILRHIRDGFNVPIIMLTARSELVDKILALETGADDYLSKPFEIRELLARIHSVLRRTRNIERDAALPSTSKSEKIRVGNIEMDIGRHQVVCSGKETDLTYVEFRLLEVLLRHAGRLVLREDIIKSVLGRSPYPYDRCIDVHIANLRKKLGFTVSSEANLIKTIRGSGYFYVIPPHPDTQIVEKGDNPR
jgi:two-component system response regulator CpxR